MAWPRSLLLSITITLGLIAMTHCATPKTKTSSIAQVLEGEEDSDPKPKEWPEQFHALLVMNNTNKPELQVVDLWYDWPNGRNLNLIQNEYGKLLYDVEWNNGTSYYFTLGVNDDGGRECTIRHFEVGVLRPNWLDGANYLGQRYVNGFLCNVWEKVDFIWYYEDVVTKRPVYWLFFTGMEAYVMTFEVGNALEDSKWQAPAHCFDKPAEQSGTLARPAGLLRPPVAFS